jgi:hypothetical protein
MSRTCVAAMILLAASAPASASFRDPATGFGIAPPTPFVTEPTTHRTFDVAVVLRSTTNLPPTVPPPDGSQPFICRAGYKAAAEIDDLTKAEINAFVGSPEWRTELRRNLETSFHIDNLGTFTLQGYRGTEVTARPKFGDSAGNVSVLLSYVETNKGRTTLTCFTDRASFAKALPQFRAVRATMTAPE